MASSRNLKRSTRPAPSRPGKRRISKTYGTSGGAGGKAAANQGGGGSTTNYGSLANDPTFE